MTAVGTFLSRVFGSHHTRGRVSEIEKEIEHHQAAIRQSTQVLESGSRVMRNMTGVMRMMAEAGREDNQ